MSLEKGPIPRSFFLGASVSSFQTTLGWNDQATVVTITLAEDPKLGQSFIRPIVGTPHTFKFGDKFSFRGIVQDWSQSDSVEGTPIYTVVLTDPREILDGVQIILGGYNGFVYVPNLINVFGYMDSFGFGMSMINEGGIPWNAIYSKAAVKGIKPALEALINNSADTRFGGPITFKGYSYKIDLSRLPTPPPYYRIGGSNISLMEMVSQICQDGGYDYFVELVNNVITFRTVDRRNPLPPNKIQEFIASKSGKVSTKNKGVELRNDYTSTFIVGGNIAKMHVVDGVGSDPSSSPTWPFWGYDMNGNPSTSEGLGDAHTANLNAFPIRDIIGSETYSCSVMEMRMALVNQSSWAWYIQVMKPDLARRIGLSSEFEIPRVVGAVPADWKNDTPQNVAYIEQLEDVKQQHANIVYNFVKQFATEYYGKKFMVAMPFVVLYIEDETGTKIWSREPADAAIENAGRSLAFTAIFVNEDGRTVPYVRFDNIKDADPSILQQQDVLYENGSLYMRAFVEPNIVRGPNGPAAIVSLPYALYTIPDDVLGGIDSIAEILGTSEQEVKEVNRRFAGGTIPVKIGPGAYWPNRLHVPLLDNANCYGPWYAHSGVAGKVNFQKNETLVPWNYGGNFGLLDSAARALVDAGGATALQELEKGTVEVAGMPDKNLGDAIMNGGPTITNVDVSVDRNGVRTSYRMSVYSPRFGTFSRANADRLRRFGISIQNQRRALKELFDKRFQMGFNVNAGSLSYLQNAPSYYTRNSAHDIILGMSFDYQGQNRRTVASMMKFDEALGGMNTQNGDYAKTGGMSLDGLLRPISTKFRYSELGSFEEVRASDTDVPVSAFELNPFRPGNDIECVVWGDTYRSLHIRRRTGDWYAARPMALRGPLVITGWGYDAIYLKPRPNSNENRPGDEFMGDYLTKSNYWKTGPVDLRWCPVRKLWGVPVVLHAKTKSGGISSESSANVVVQLGGQNSEHEIEAHNIFNEDIDEDIPIIVGFNPLENKWLVIAAQCGQSE